jgi:adenylate cyclase
VPEFAERVQALKSRFDYDARLADALRERPVILGYFLSNEPNAVTKGGLPAAVFTTDDLEGRLLPASTYRSYAGNLAGLQQAARAGLGASVISPVFFSREELGMSEENYLAYGAIKGLWLNSKPASTFIPVERNLTVLINFRGPDGPAGGQFRYIPAVGRAAGRDAGHDRQASCRTKNSMPAPVIMLWQAGGCRTRASTGA